MASLDANLYLHESARAALAVLKAIPGFHQVMKAFMKIWSERQFRIINMYTNGLFETIPDELLPTVLAHECAVIIQWGEVFLTVPQIS